MENKKYNIIYSLGVDCACASYMKMYGLRSYSGPFDWLTHALFKTRMELILNDFNDFFNLEDLKLLPKDPNVFNDEKCDYYENIRNGFYFYHDFPAGVSLKESLPKVKAKYKRRINRFYNKIQTSEKVLLLWLAHNQSTPDDLIKELCGKACAKFGKNVDFLIIEHDETKTKDEIECINISENIVKYKMITAGFDEKGNPTTLGNEENCGKIFSQYKLEIPLHTRFISLLFKKTVKILCWFIPSKKYRNQLRKSAAFNN